MKIGLDLDEVVADFLPALLRHHNAIYDTTFCREDVHSYRLWEVWGGTQEETIQKVHGFYQTPGFRNILPLPGALKGIQLLRQEHELHIITSRQEYVAQATREWVEQHFPKTFSGVHFGNHYAQQGKATKKSHICDALQVDFMVDDSLVYAADCASPKRKVLLLDSPWNQCSELPEGVQRVFSWDEIVAAIQKEV